jgi:hypothetical protein
MRKRRQSWQRKTWLSITAIFIQVEEHESRITRSFRYHKVDSHVEYHLSIHYPCQSQMIILLYLHELVYS